MEVDVKNESATSIVNVKGDIDMYTSSQLRSIIVDILAKSIKKLVVHLSLVTYIDSSGVAVLIDALKRCGKKDISFFITEPSKVVLDVMDLALLSDVFNIKNTLQEAIDA